MLLFFAAVFGGHKSFWQFKKHYKLLRQQFIKQKVLYKIQAPNSRHEEVRHITLGLALFWQDVVTSAVVRYWALVPADVFQFGFCTYFQLLVINLAAVPGGRFPNSKTTPSPDRCMLCHWTTFGS